MATDSSDEYQLAVEVMSLPLPSAIPTAANCLQSRIASVLSDGNTMMIPFELGVTLSASGAFTPCTNPFPPHPTPYL